MLRNKCICENGHSIFVIFRTPVNSVNFQYDKSVPDTSYLIFKDFNIICLTKKNFVDVTTCWCNIHRHKKNSADLRGFFWNFHDLMYLLYINKRWSIVVKCCSWYKQQNLIISICCKKDVQLFIYAKNFRKIMKFGWIYNRIWKFDFFE